MFDSWGGGLRELCERGFVCYTAGPEKALRLCPPLEPLSAHAAQLTLARRYFTHYAPATIHDAMYFFHASAKAVRGWLAELPVHSAHCSGREYFWLERLLEEGDFSREEKVHAPVQGAVSVCYWLVVTAVFLLYTFGPNGNGQPQYSWVIWAIGGVLYAALLTALRLFRKR